MKKSVVRGLIVLGMMFCGMNAWGQCYIVNESTTKELKLSSGTVATYTWNAAQKTNGQVSFEAKTSMATTSNAKNMTLQQTLDGTHWSDVKTYSLGTSYATYTCNTLSKDALGIRFQVGGLYTRNVKNVTVGYGTNIGDPSAGSLSFGNVFVDDAMETKTLTIAWCNTNALTATLPANSQYSVLIDNNATTCTYGTATVSVVYNHTLAGTHDETLTITGTNYSKTILLSGITNQRAQSLAWNNESDINVNMMVGVNQQMTATATSSLKVTYASSNDAVLSVDENGNLLAKSVGTAVITASQLGNTVYSAAPPITKTIQVKSKDTPVFLPEGFSEVGIKNMKVGEMVTLDVSNVSDGLSGLFVAGNYDSDVLSISRAGSTITIEAVGEGSTSVTFRQTETATIFAAEKTYSFAVSKVENMLTVAEIHEMYVDDVATSVVGNKQSDGVITTTSTDATVAYYDVAQNKLLAVNTNNQSFDEKEVTITISQAATTKYSAANKTIVLNVKKYDNQIYINGQQSFYASNIYMDGYDNITLTATNTDYVGSPITNQQTEGLNLATFYPSDKVIYTTNILGIARWTISQAESYKYKAATASMSIEVIKATEATDCYVLNDNSTTLEGKLGANTQELSWTDEHAAKTLYFNAQRQSGSVGDVITVYQRVNGEWSSVGGKITNYGTSPTPEEVDLNQDATAVRFNIAGSFKNYITNIRVTRKTYLTAPDVMVSKTASNNDIYPAQEGVGTLVVNHSLANGGELKLAWNNPKFTINGKSAAEGVNLGNLDCTTGVSNLPISYVSNEAGVDVANVVVYNSVYRVEAVITGTTVKRAQTITWKTGFSQMTIGQEETDAATATLGGVTYTSSDPSVIRVDDGTKLVAVAQGKATITAFAQGNSEYDDVSSTLEITVTDKQVQYIHWNQSLLHLHVGDENVVLNAYASQDEALGCSDSSRPISYVSSNEEVVRVVDGNRLQVVGFGTAVLKATQAGGLDADGHDYISVSQEKKVAVIDPDAPCESYIYEQTAEHTFSLGWNAADKQTKTFEIDFNGQEPGYCNFDYKGEPQKVLINYYDGDMYIDELVDGKWTQVKALGQPSTSGYKNTGNVALSRKATKMRVRVKDGMGFQYVKDCQVTLARYMETTDLNPFEARVGSEQTQYLTVAYSNISQSISLSLSANSSFVLNEIVIEGECGDKGSHVVAITYKPEVLNTDEQATLTITDGELTKVVTLSGKSSVTPLHIDWDWEQTTCYTVDIIHLHGAVSKNDFGDVAGEVYYSLSGESTTGTLLDGNRLVFNNPGTAIVVANTVPDERYAAAPAVSKTIVVEIKPVLTYVLSGEWNDPTQWSEGFVPTEEVNVIVDADVTIHSEVSVSSLTINPGASVTLDVQGKLNVGDENSAEQENYGNLYVRNGGEVNLSDGVLKVKDFVIESALSATNGMGVSGRMTNPDALSVMGDAYVDITFVDGPMSTSEWYGFTVPFPVDATAGIFRPTSAQHLTNNRDYVIARYNSIKRYETGKGWEYYSGILNPGEFYYIGVDNVADNTLRFRKIADAPVVSSNVKAVALYGDASLRPADANWNAVGNPTLSYATASFQNKDGLPTFVQTYVNGESRYQTIATTSASFVVGTPFFIQSTQECELILHPADAQAYLAPRRNKTNEHALVSVTIAKEDNRATDRVYLLASEDATETYQLGHDLVKAGVGTGVAQLWLNGYGKQLSVQEALLVSNQASYDLTLFAPTAGVYTLAMQDTDSETTIYLTQDDVVIWNLSESAYSADLSKGNNTSYGLRLVRKAPEVVTGAESISMSTQVGKVVVDGMLYILRDGQSYDAQGHRLH